MAAKRVHITTSLPEDVREQFKEYCDLHGLKLNRTLERIVIFFLKNPRLMDEMQVGK